jgi:hypothetical protein
MKILILIIFILSIASTKTVSKDIKILDLSQFSHTIFMTKFNVGVGEADITISYT